LKKNVWQLGMWKLGAGGRAAQVHVLSLLVSGMLMRAYLSSATAAEECQCVIIFVGSSSGTVVRYRVSWVLCRKCSRAVGTIDMRYDMI